MNDKQKDYVWVQNLISTCETDLQLECATNIIDLHYQKHGNKDMRDALRMQLNNHPKRNTAFDG